MRCYFQARLVLEEKNAHLNETVMQLRETVRDMEARKSGADQEFGRLQLDLSEAQKKLSVAEASIEVSHRVAFYFFLNRYTLLTPS